MTFRLLEGDTAIVRQGGVFRTCDLYEWGGRLFVKFGPGYIRLNATGTTSKDGVQVEQMAYEGSLYADKFGRLCAQPVNGATLLPGDKTVLLLGGPDANA